MHTVQLLLKPTEYEKKELERRFYAISRIHNICVKYVRKQLVRLEHDKEYQEWRKEYIRLSNDKKAKPKVKGQGKQYLSSQMNQRREEYGLTSGALEKYVKVCQKRNSKMISSHQAQAEAARVWKGVDKYLFGNGKEVHFKKCSDFKTIGGKSNSNGIKFDPETMVIKWNDLELSCFLLKRPASRRYIKESMNAKISYCELKRRMFSSGWRYYIILVLDGSAPCKRIDQETAPDSAIGIDPGVSTMAATSYQKCFLEELAPKADQYDKKLQALLVKMDISKRISNPNKFNPDGTCKRKNKDPWVFSKNYIRMRRKLRTLYRQKSEYILSCHRNLCNRMLNVAHNIIVEHMDYRALARRVKETKRQEKESKVQKKDGTITSVHKYKKKKRFGKSINRRAPANFLSELKRKAIAAGGTYLETNTKTFKASQYDHVADEYKKSSLDERFKEIGGKPVQRDLYSSFLTLNTDSTLKHADREKCIATFDQFVENQNQLINEMKQSGITMKQCFGF